LGSDARGVRGGPIGSRGPGHDDRKLLEAVHFFALHSITWRAALKEWTRERVPLDWARAQNNLAKAEALLNERREKLQNS
jgi:hypothetical protein